MKQSTEMINAHRWSERDNSICESNFTYGKVINKSHNTHNKNNNVQHELKNI